MGGATREMESQYPYIVEFFQVTSVRWLETHNMIFLWFHPVEYGASIIREIYFFPT